jgi:preprotein translocase subunit SecD
MKELRFRIFMILFFAGLSIYLLYPTFQDYQNNKEIRSQIATIKNGLEKTNPTLSQSDLRKILVAKEDSLKNANPSYKSAREKRMKLGLDLQGGMYLVMEVNTGKLLEKLAKDPDKEFMTALKEAENQVKLTDENVVNVLAAKLQAKGKRLSRYFGTIREDDAKIISDLKQQEEDAVSRAIEIIRNRVDQYGVSEPSIQKQGSRRIVVELPGVAKEEEAKRLVQGSALLEFRLVKEHDATIPVMQRIDDLLAGKIKFDSTGAIDTTFAAQKDTAKEKDLTKEEFMQKHPFFAIVSVNTQSQFLEAYVNEKDKAKLMQILSREDVLRVIPDNSEFVFSAKPEIESQGNKYYKIYFVNKNPELTGDKVVDAMANIDQQTTAAIVNMQMNSEGAREWSRITGANIGRRCAIMLDGVIYSAPEIKSKIPSGSSQISGMANLEEAKLLEIVLKAGALPAPIDVIEERTVGPSLGQDSIAKGFNSALLGFFLVAVFMILYYKKLGIVADIGLITTILFTLGILAGFHATLTLPGIAGIVLTMGMAVDANVIIYERMREEMRGGKTFKAAIDSGYSNSFSAIFDSNITTFFTGIILYQFGSGPIQGFALTLMIGIGSTLFSALVVSRVVLEFMAAKGMKLKFA